MQCNNARLLTGDMYAASVNNSSSFQQGLNNR